MGARAGTQLPKPKIRGSQAFQDALKPIGDRDQAEFKGIGIGVIDFTRSQSKPDVWVHNEDEPYRIGSATKIAILLAATQLRCDVRRVRDLNLISTKEEFDALFANPKLWAKAHAPPPEMPHVRQIASNPPLVSKILDFTNAKVDFAGLDPDGRKDAHYQPVAAVQDAIFAKLHGGSDLRWETWDELTFSDRLWLAGSHSDNVAATSCLSELGVPYVKAVQRAYGLANHDAGMHLLLSGGYDQPKAKRKPSDAAPPRPIEYSEPFTVDDFWWSSRTGKFSDKSSHVPGSAAALTAYMIALMTDQLVIEVDGSGLAGCTTIKKNLGDGGPYDVDKLTEFPGHPGAIPHGVLSVPNTKINLQIDKIGLLATQTRPPGPKAFLRCEFMYLETKQDPAPAHGRNEMKYAIVATGVIADAVPGKNAATKSVLLGAAVHQALLSLP
jgi:hypothetical protein